MQSNGPLPQVNNFEGEMISKRFFVDKWGKYNLTVVSAPQHDSINAHNVQVGNTDQCVCTARCKPMKVRQWHGNIRSARTAGGSTIVEIEMIIVQLLTAAENAYKVHRKLIVDSHWMKGTTRRWASTCYFRAGNLKLMQKTNKNPGVIHTFRNSYTDIPKVFKELWQSVQPH